MTNIFGDFRRLVIAALDDLAARARCRPGSISRASRSSRRATRRMAISRPTPRWCWPAPAKQNPMALAEKIAAALAGRELASAGYRGSGFTVDGSAARFSQHPARPGGVARAAARDPARRHRLRRLRLGARRAVNVEFVSANPTGPMHVGHGRGAVVGDALAALLAKAGFAVHREYYINDAGAQVDVLARSAYLRYREALGESDRRRSRRGFIPANTSSQTGRALAERDGDKWLGRPEAEWLGAGARIRGRRDDAADPRRPGGARRRASTPSSRSASWSRAARSMRRWRRSTERGLIYEGVLEPPKGKLPDDWEPRPQTLFRATQFGDEVDRPLKKSDGSWTYFAADIAYHHDKVRRGFDNLIDVWGADHGGYVKRMQAAVKALTERQRRRSTSS